MKKKFVWIAVLALAVCLAVFFSLMMSASYAWPTSYGGKTDLDWSYHKNTGADGKANMAYYSDKGEDLRWLLICLCAGSYEQHAGGDTYDAYARFLMDYYNTNQAAGFTYPESGIDSPAPAMIDVAVQQYISSLSSGAKANSNVASAISSYNALVAAVAELRTQAYADQIIYNYELVPSLMRDSYQNIVSAVYQYEHPEVPLKFQSASLALQSDLSILFNVKRSVLTDGNYSDPYVVFTMNGNPVTVRTYTESDGILRFRFANIAPYQMGDTVSAVLYATKQDGTLASSSAVEYGVGVYCERMFARTTTGASLKTMMVDLLNYGAASQISTEYKTDDLANSILTSEQQALGTSANPVCRSVSNSSYATITSPKASWRSASLLLRERVSMQIKFRADDVSGYTVRIQNTSGTLLHTVTPDEFVDLGSGVYSFRYDGLTSVRFSETILFTVYSGETPVSNTLSYSVESYAASKQNGSDTVLANLVNALMKYGNSAYSYVYPSYQLPSSYQGATLDWMYYINASSSPADKQKINNVYAAKNTTAIQQLVNLAWRWDVMFGDGESAYAWAKSLVAAGYATEPSNTGLTSSAAYYVRAVGEAWLESATAAEKAKAEREIGYYRFLVEQYRSFISAAYDSNKVLLCMDVLPQILADAVRSMISVAGDDPADWTDPITALWPENYKKTDGLDITSKTGLISICYSTWHDYTTGLNSFREQTISEIAKTGSWSSDGSTFYFWGKPELGYYQSSDRTVIRRHMTQLAEAGVDFIIVDNTNLTIDYKTTVCGNVDGNPTMWNIMVTRPVTALLEECLAMREEGLATPYIVFWNSGSDWKVTEAVYDQFFLQERYKNLWVYWNNKPLFLTSSITASPTRNITVRKMWGLQSSLGSNEWTFLQKNNTRKGSSNEQMTVGVAMQRTYMSNTSTATGRNHGITFYNQWKNAFAAKPKVVTISWWNEWAAQRQSNGAFTDAYNTEYSRDIEPMSGGHGDQYYQWMKQYIAAYKAGKSCPRLVEAGY